MPNFASADVSMCVGEAIQEIETLVSRLNTDDSPPTRPDIAVVGKLASFTKEFFDAGYPFFGHDDQPKMRISAKIMDSTNILSNVVLWDEPCKTIFATNGATLLNKWVLCDNAEMRDEVLAILNACDGKEYKFLGSLDAWVPTDGSPSVRNVKFQVDCVVALA